MFHVKHLLGNFVSQRNLQDLVLKLKQNTRI